MGQLPFCPAQDPTERLQYSSFDKTDQNRIFSIILGDSIPSIKSLCPSGTSTADLDLVDFKFDADPSEQKGCTYSSSFFIESKTNDGTVTRTPVMSRRRRSVRDVNGKPKTRWRNLATGSTGTAETCSAQSAELCTAGSTGVSIGST
jgi:hypothetical protein